MTIPGVLDGVIETLDKMLLTQEELRKKTEELLELKITLLEERVKTSEKKADIQFEITKLLRQTIENLARKLETL